MLFVDGLRKRFGSIVALDGLDLSAEPGRILGFLGPNGSGKSTAMRAIMGLIDPDSGDIRLDRNPVDRRMRLRFGYMPEERGLYPKMRVGEQLSYFARLSGLGHRAAEAAAAEWLSRFGISERASDKVETLSHGNQQRVQLAVSLVHAPDVAILDEPFAGLDPVAMDTMADTLRNLAARGAVIVFSSHQLDLVEDICQDVVIIDGGKDVLAGRVQDLRNSAPSRYLEIDVDGRPWKTELRGAGMQARNGRHRYVVARDASISEILEMARRDGEVTRFTFEPPSLSDLFREAVAR